MPFFVLLFWSLTAPSTAHLAHACRFPFFRETALVHGQPQRPIDWTGQVKQFNLHDALMAKHPGDAANPEHAARRLARNAHRLGKELTPDQHRELIDFSIPAKLLQPFNGTIEKARLSMNGTVDELPFQSGPGVLYGLPEATVDFWEGKEGASPTQMWEVVVRLDSKRREVPHVIVCPPHVKISSIYPSLLGLPSG